MSIRAYVINLDRSADRREAIMAVAAAARLEVIRVPAVDGKAVPPAQRTILDEAGFRRDHGKHPMPGEFGCYASHIKALGVFLESEDEFALILEDDAKIPADILTTLEEISAVDDWDLVKLTHHRMTKLMTDRTLSGGRRLGRAVFGPTGSSAAYLVNRHAAERLLTTLTPMTLPYDVALERGWAHGIRVRHVTPDVVSINALTRKSLTRDGKSYSQMQLKPWRRLTTLRFRTIDLIQRLRGAFG